MWPESKQAGRFYTSLHLRALLQNRKLSASSPTPSDSAACPVAVWCWPDAPSTSTTLRPSLPPTPHPPNTASVIKDSLSKSAHRNRIEHSIPTRTTHSRTQRQQTTYPRLAQRVSVGPGCEAFRVPGPLAAPSRRPVCCNLNSLAALCCRLGPWPRRLAKVLALLRRKTIELPVPSQ